MNYYAHSNASDKSEWQTVKEHLENTARLARELSQGTNLSDFAYIAALFHDLGKYSQAFQRRLEGARIKVDHSTAGAKEIIHAFQGNPKQRLISEMLAFCIAGHHAGLPDYGSSIDCGEESTLKARLKSGVEDYQAFSQDIDISQVKFPEQIPIRPIKSCKGFSLAFFTRMVYSVLVDADFLETETFMSATLKPRGGYPGIPELHRALNQFLERFANPIGPINQQRSETLKACISGAEKPPGLYTLTVPTGGGKTFASLAFALKHALLHGKNRVIYVIPYTSIIEQNAAEFKRCLGDENVLEHHSNFDWGRDFARKGADSYDERTDNLLQKLKLAAENWDIPIVVTTNVQFFESLFAHRSSRCRKLHNMANSVIIFDEAQMLPRDYLKPCLYAVYELIKNYGATAVFCTATQPALGTLFPEGMTAQELSPDAPALYEFYKRVQVQKIGRLPDEEIIQRMNAQPQVLCIVNTRKHARGLFSGLQEEGSYHLSTLMCPAHRKVTIRDIRTRLKQGLDCRVVSTQIMEAGIDIDFPVGYRALAGLDSIIQAAGRVNREGRAKSASLYVFEPDSIYVKRTPAYIQQGAEVAQSILRRFSDPVCLQAIQAYYQELYSLQSASAFDRKNVIGCFEKGIPGEPNFDFQTADRNFNIIEDSTVSVVIPYDEEALALLDAARWNKYPLSFSRKLQVYSVNIYQQEFQALAGKGAIDLYADTYNVLNDMSFYDAATGLAIPEGGGGEAIFFDG
jgi:CRISPR-associated endonuclease/helicase Cas3